LPLNISISVVSDFGLKPNLKPEFQTEVNLSIGLQPDFRVQIKLWFQTKVLNFDFNKR